MFAAAQPPGAGQAGRVRVSTYFFAGVEAGVDLVQDGLQRFGEHVPFALDVRQADGIHERLVALARKGLEEERLEQLHRRVSDQPHVHRFEPAEQVGRVVLLRHVDDDELAVGEDGELLDGRRLARARLPDQQHRLVPIDARDKPLHEAQHVACVRKTLVVPHFARSDLHGFEARPAHNEDVVLELHVGLGPLRDVRDLVQRDVERGADNDGLRGGVAGARVGRCAVHAISTTLLAPGHKGRQEGGGVCVCGWVVWA